MESALTSRVNRCNQQVTNGTKHQRENCWKIVRLIISISSSWETNKNPLEAHRNEFISFRRIRYFLLLWFWELPKLHQYTWLESNSSILTPISSWIYVHSAASRCCLNQRVSESSRPNDLDIYEAIGQGETWTASLRVKPSLSEVCDELNGSCLLMTSLSTTTTE